MTERSSAGRHRTSPARHHLPRTEGSLLSAAVGIMRAPSDRMAPPCAGVGTSMDRHHLRSRSGSLRSAAVAPIPVLSVKTALPPAGVGATSAKLGRQLDQRRQLTAGGWATAPHLNLLPGGRGGTPPRPSLSLPLRRPLRNPPPSVFPAKAGIHPSPVGASRDSPSPLLPLWGRARAARRASARRALLGSPTGKPAPGCAAPGSVRRGSGRVCACGWS